MKNALMGIATILSAIMFAGVFMFYSSIASADSSDGNINDPVMIFKPANQLASSWKYTMTLPPENWVAENFIDTSWPMDYGAFGNTNSPQDAVRTNWGTNDIWLRTTISLTAQNLQNLDKFIFWCRHDNGVEVYVNGELAASAPYWTAMYDFLKIYPEGRQAFREGNNVLAVHCHNDSGPGYIDIGLALNPLYDLPVSGYDTSFEYSAYSDAVKSFAEKNLIPATGFAMMDHNQVVAVHGFGYMDKALTQPVPANVMMCESLIDNVFIQGLARTLIKNNYIIPVTGQPFSLDTTVFPTLVLYGLTPPQGSTIDPRINQITVGQLMNSTSGIAYPPDPQSLFNAFNVNGGTTALEMARWLYGEPVRFQPGSQTSGSNSETFILRYLIDKITGDFLAYFKANVLSICGTQDFELAHDNVNQRNAREPFYATKSYPNYDYVYKDNLLELIFSPEAAVRYFRWYYLGAGTQLINPSTGQWAAIPDNGWSWYWWYGGGFSSLFIQRRWDQKSFVVMFNQAGVDNNIDSLVDQFNLLANGQQSHNQPPTVEAGNDRTIMPSNSTNLNGQVHDDGLPVNGVLKSIWTKISGPGDVIFSISTVCNTDARFTAQGTYVLQITCTDGELSSLDTVTIHVGNLSAAVANWQLYQ